MCCLQGVYIQHNINYDCGSQFYYNLIKLIIQELDMMAELPKAPLRRFFKEAGADRVSDEAVCALHDFLVEEALTLARNSVQLSEYNNRKTVQLKDVNAVLSLE